MRKIKNIYIQEEDGHNFVVLEAEDGTLYRQEDIATGNCWMLYWVEQKKKQEVEELVEMILKVNREQYKSSH